MKYRIYSVDANSEYHLFSDSRIPSDFSDLEILRSEIEAAGYECILERGRLFVTDSLAAGVYAVASSRGTGRIHVKKK